MSREFSQCFFSIGCTHLVGFIMFPVKSHLHQTKNYKGIRVHTLGVIGKALVSRI
jgi:hypothetical protein